MTDNRTIIRAALDELELALQQLQSKLGLPIWVGDVSKGRFRYARPDSRHFLVLRAVRIVSGLNAMVHLLEAGYVQEMGVLARTIDDFLGEMRFVQEAHRTGNPTADQKRLIEQFFSDELTKFQEFKHESKPTSYLPKRKVRAAEARQIAIDGDLHGAGKIVEYIDKGFDGYVHGHYHHIMELYEGDKNGRAELYRVQGMLGTPNIKSWEREIGILIVAAFNEFAEAAWALGDSGLRKQLIEQREQFEASPAYGTD